MITTLESSQNGERRGTAQRFRRLLVTAALGMAGFGLGVGAGPTVSADASACTVSGPVTADAADRQIQNCLDAREAEYTACMLDAPGTADSLERWVEYCRSTDG